LNTSFDDYYNDNYQCYIVECDNSNALCISELTDDIIHLTMTNDFGFESFGNDNGFYGKTYVFFEFPDEKEATIDESLLEDTIKQGNSWVNKGAEGTHGKFKTKKEADAQRKAMFAQGFNG